MNFVFISPNFPSNYDRFCLGLKNNGVNVLGVGDCPYEHLSETLKYALTEYYLVDTLEDYDAMVRALGYFTHRYGKIDWLESNNEYWLAQDAALRTDFNITTGLKSEDILLYKRKSLMKAGYAKAGIPAARWAMAENLASALDFVQKVGYPIVVKPDSGVGAEATYRIENEEQLAAFFKELPPVPYIMEEYVSGEVTTFDGVADSRGKVLFAVSHITPGSIMDMVNEHKPVYYYVDKEVPADIRAAGRKVLRAFKVRSRFFHLEFFRLTEAKEGLGEVGDIVALEVNMRPAGGYTPDMINFSQSSDCYQIWADMAAFDELRHIYKGPKTYCVCAGRRDDAVYTHGIGEIKARFGSHIVLDEILPPALARAMGNQILLACFDGKAEMEEFLRFSFSPMEIGALSAKEQM
ncbi:MAG: ATP-grasp domain-containing protein [Bacteroidales bacterium]|nr:ATP-grasp domain-containing protein [Bacteroidales bacterium]